MNLEDFLEHKTLYYDKIELNAMQLAWQKLSSIVNLGFVVHIVGAEFRLIRIMRKPASLGGRTR